MSNIWANLVTALGPTVAATAANIVANGLNANVTAVENGLNQIDSQGFSSPVMPSIIANVERAAVAIQGIPPGFYGLLESLKTAKDVASFEATLTTLRTMIQTVASANTSLASGLSSAATSVTG